MAAISTLREIDAKDSNFIPSGGHPSTLGEGRPFIFLSLAVGFLDLSYVLTIKPQITPREKESGL
jgi:hypothetical protein